MSWRTEAVEMEGCTSRNAQGQGRQYYKAGKDCSASCYKQGEKRKDTAL